ncbi:MAG: hypothetical protein Q7R81_05635 [Candidatus Peregrinibacteria bacterium]|nr:hypothetical protein [Candidatus Peregrinibacteria bacterium]
MKLNEDLNKQPNLQGDAERQAEMPDVIEGQRADYEATLDPWVAGIRAADQRNWTFLQEKSLPRLAANRCPAFFVQVSGGAENFMDIQHLLDAYHSIADRVSHIDRKKIVRTLIRRAANIAPSMALVIVNREGNDQDARSFAQETVFEALRFGKANARQIVVEALQELFGNDERFGEVLCMIAGSFLDYGEYPRLLSFLQKWSKGAGVPRYAIERLPLYAGWAIHKVTDRELQRQFQALSGDEIE